ncbi:MAG: hypothetical protein NT042_08555 [Sulfuritalea sp.]|nr:hypothetical protein [Sulfuritalea sp.]
MKNWKWIVLACLGVSLGACVHLQEVRDFASESAKLSGYTGVIDHTLGGYARSEPYLIDDVRATEKKADQARQASRESLLSLHNVAAVYMTTLAKLAGEDAFSVDTGIDKVAKSIKAAPEFKIEQPTVDAYAKLVQIVAKWVSEAAQEKAVKAMVQDGKDNFDKVLTGMADIVRILGKIHENEQRSVLDGLDSMISTTPATPGNYLTLALARDQLNQKRIEYNKANALYVEAAKGIKAIQEGHRTLAENLDRLDAKDVTDRLKKLRDDIKNVRAALASAGA